MSGPEISCSLRCHTPEACLFLPVISSVTELSNELIIARQLNRLTERGEIVIDELDAREQAVEEVARALTRCALFKQALDAAT